MASTGRKVHGTAGGSVSGTNTNIYSNGNFSFDLHEAPGIISSGNPVGLNENVNIFGIANKVLGYGYEANISVDFNTGDLHVTASAGPPLLNVEVNYAANIRTLTNFEFSWDLYATIETGLNVGALGHGGGASADLSLGSNGLLGGASLNLGTIGLELSYSDPNFGSVFGTSFYGNLTLDASLNPYGPAAQLLSSLAGYHRAPNLEAAAEAAQAAAEAVAQLDAGLLNGVALPGAVQNLVEGYRTGIVDPSITLNAPAAVYANLPTNAIASANVVVGPDGTLYVANPSIPSTGLVYEGASNQTLGQLNSNGLSANNAVGANGLAGAPSVIGGFADNFGGSFINSPTAPNGFDPVWGTGFDTTGITSDGYSGGSGGGGSGDGSYDPPGYSDNGSSSNPGSGATSDYTNDAGVSVGTDVGFVDSGAPTVENPYDSVEGYGYLSPDTLSGDSDSSTKPIILDLDGDGVEIVPLSQSTVYVDAGGDGLLHRTAWAGDGDGVLFYDPDDTGAITEKRQYVFTEWDPTATSDLEALRSIFDSNGDGVFDDSDDAFDDFKLLVTESDGSTVARTLDYLSIESIDLTGDSTHIKLPDGSTITGQTDFTRTDGSTGSVANTALVADAQGRRVEQTEATDGSGNRTLETVAYAGDGTIVYTISSVFSPDGSDISHAYDDNGDGAIDRLQTITVADVSGDSVETVTNYLGAVLADAIMTDQTVTTKSADGLTTTIQRDSTGGGWFDQEEIRQEQTDGSYINTISDLAEDGSVIRSVSETVSVDGLLRTTSADQDGDGNADLVTTHEIDIAVDNSRTEKITEKNADNTLRSKVTEDVSADGQSKTVERDFDGDGNIDTEEILSITVNTDGTTDSVLTTRNGDGSTRSVTTSNQSDDALTKTTAVDIDGDAVDDIETIEATAINGDGSRQTVTTVSNADLSLRSMEKVTLGADKVTSETWRDLNQDGTFQSTDLVRSVEVDATTQERTTTTWVRNADGSASAKTVSVASLDGLTRITEVDADGDGDTDTKTSDVTTVDGNGIATQTVETRNQNDSLRSQNVTTTSADGLTIETETNWDGDANVDRYISDVRELETDGSSTRTITTKAGDDTTLLSQSVETQSADRLERVLTVDANGDGETDVVSQSVQAADGSMTETTTTYNPDGVVSGTTETTTSANGLTATSRTDNDGDGVFEAKTVAVTTIAVNGSRTTTQSVINADDSLRAQSEAWIRDDGFEKIVKTDADGDGTFERSSESETVLDSNGSRTTTVELRDADDDLLSSTVTVVSDDGLITTVSTDRDGDGTVDFIRTTETDLLADGGTEVTSELYDTATPAVLRESSRVTTNDNGRSILTELDINGDGITDREVSREIGDDGTLTVTEQNLDTNGGLISGRVTVTSDDGLLTTTAYDRDGNGFDELIVETLRTLNADGSITEVTSEMGKPLSVFSQTQVTTSDDGLQTTEQQDWNNDGVVDLTIVDEMSFAADGSETRSIVRTAADASTLSIATISTSADRRLVTDSFDADGNGNNDRITTTTVADSGISTVENTWFSTGGAVIATAVIETSANGLNETRTVDRNGDGEAERIVTSETTLGQDGSVTRTIEHRDYLNILHASERYVRSDDGLATSSQIDLDGDGSFDFYTTDETSYESDGDTVRTQVTLNQYDDLRSRIDTRVSGDGLSTTVETDYTGNGTINRLFDHIEFADGSWTDAFDELDDSGELIRSVDTTMSADERTQTVMIDRDGDGLADRSIVTETDLDRTVVTTYADLTSAGLIEANAVRTVNANGMSTSVIFDIDGDSLSDIARETEIVFDTSGNTIKTFTETYGAGTLAYGKVTTTAADELSGTAEIDADGDGDTDGTTSWQTTLNDDGSRETITETYYSNGDLRSKVVEAVSADGRTTTKTRDYDGNGIADKVTVIQLSADGEMTETITTYNEAGIENATFVTTTSADGLETTILRPEALQTISRSPIGNGTYIWDNGISGAGHIKVVHEVDALGIEAWTSTQEIASGTEVFEAHLDSGAKERILADAARIYDTMLDRDMDFVEIETLVEFVVDGELNGESLADKLLASTEFQVRYGTQTDAEYITQIYLNSFGRAPSLSELDQRLKDLDGGLAKAGLADALADSVEHYVVGNSHILTNNHDVLMNPALFERNLDEAYVRSVVEKVIDVIYDRAASDLELEELSQRLLSGDDSLEDVVDTLLSVDGHTFGLETATLVDLSGEALIDQAFLGALGRYPTSIERTTWSENLSSGLLSEAQFVASLAISVDHSEAGGDHLQYSTIVVTPTLGTASDDTMTGTADMDQLEGLEGADDLDGGDGADVLIGGAGGDTLRGGNGNDIYYWSKGDGNDVIFDEGASLTETDTLVFLDVSSDDVELWRGIGESEYNDNLYISILSTSEEIHVWDQIKYGNKRFGIEAISFSDGITWSLAEILEKYEVRGSLGNDDFNSFDYGENFFGFDGNDTLSSGEGDDHLTGGLGVDLLKGGAGNDTYYWSKGDGNDTIDETGTSLTEIDTLVLTDVNSDMVELTRIPTTDNLSILVVETGEIIEAKDQFQSIADTQGIEKILFADGVTWSLSDIFANTKALGSNPSANQTFLAFDYRDNQFGEAGDDTLNGGGGDDHLTGGTGVDTLRGDEGSDTYYWSKNDGEDILIDLGTSLTEIDTLILSDVASDGVEIWRPNGIDGIRVTVIATEETIAIYDQNYSVNESRGIERIQFSDGVVWDRSDIATKTILSGTADSETLIGYDFRDNIFGEAENDTINAAGGDDTLLGGTGNDTLRGGSGNDTYVYDLGDGNDTIEETSGHDRILFGADITAASLVFSRTGRDALITMPDGAIITIKDEVVSRIEVFEFADGTIMDATVFGYINAVGTSGSDNFLGHDGDDVLNGGAGSDTISGGDGDDTIYGGSESDTLTGGRGADLIYGGTGNDTFVYSYGDGDDVYVEEGGTDTLAFGEGIDSAETSYERNGNDLLVHMADGSIITIVDFNQFDIETFTFADGTVIDASRFQDEVLDGGGGADTIDGSLGNDTLNGFDGGDTLIGGEGEDSLNGGAGSDYMNGDAEWLGDDAVGDNDILNGGAGDDFMYGDGDLSQNAVGGNDTLNGDGGDDKMRGDGYELRDNSVGGDDVLNGGDGDDLMYGDGALYDNAIGGDDTLNGDGGEDEMYGDAYGMDGNNVGGDDALNGGADDDFLNGDAYWLDDNAIGGNDVLNGGSGRDEAYGDGDLYGYAIGGDDTLSGGLNGDWLYGDGYRIEENSVAGNDTLYGDDGNDDLYGDAYYIKNNSIGGDDILDGGEGDDFVNGDGYDLRDDTTGGDDVLYGGNGADDLYGDGDLYENAEGGDDNLYGDDGDDIVSGDGYSMDDNSVGGDDVLNGGAGNDTLYGDAKFVNDYAISGNDVLSGGDGDDWLYGDGYDLKNGATAGDDTLTGGLGDDLFGYANSIGNDVITDFTAGAGTEDVIEFYQVAGLSSYAELISKSSDDGIDTTITLDVDNTIVLQNVLVSELSSDDFVFL